MSDLSNDPEERPLSEEQKMQINEVKDLESDFLRLCERTGKSRELSLAITNMQQAAFWACRHVRGEE